MDPDQLKRKLAAILSADVKGYSRLMGEDEEWTLRTLKAYKETMGSLIQQHQGRVVGTAGDSVLAEFGSVVDAVQCAVEIQQVLKAKNAVLPETRKMNFRIGINLGDVIEEGDSIYGDGVNIAARLEGLADAGGICISESAYQQIENKIPLRYDYLGEHEVKNIAKPVRVYRARIEPEGTAEKKAKSRPWPMAAIGLVMVAVAALGIWKFNILSTPKPEVTSKGKIAVSQTEKVPTVASPSTEGALKEPLIPSLPEKASKPAAPPAPKVEVAHKEKMAFPLPDKPSIAVLPFVNLTGDPQKEFFSDGLTEDLITTLSKVPNLFVIARNSTFAYKGKPVKVQQVAEDLGVRYVLEGSIQKAGQRVRITAQLIDALKGHHIWSERYDREMKQLLTLQDRIALEILKALDVKLIRGEQPNFGLKNTDNLEAYIKMMQFRQVFMQWNKESNIQARQLAEEVIRLDPRWYAGYNLLALVNELDVWLGMSKSPKESLMKAIELDQKALSLDDSNARVLAHLGYLYVQVREHEKGLAAGGRAIEIAPNLADAYATYAQMLNYSGRAEEAVAFIEKAFRLNPFPPIFYFTHAAHTYRLIGRYEDAARKCQECLARWPNAIIAQVALACNYAAWGHDEEARAAAQGVLRIDPKFSAQRYARAFPYKDPAQSARVLELMRKAGLPD
jgi:adenylate cyclase